MLVFKFLGLFYAITKLKDRCDRFQPVGGVFVETERVCRFRLQHRCDLCFQAFTYGGRKLLTKCVGVKLNLAERMKVCFRQIVNWAVANGF